MMLDPARMESVGKSPHVKRARNQLISSFLATAEKENKPFPNRACGLSLWKGASPGYCFTHVAKIFSDKRRNVSWITSIH